MSSKKDEIPVVFKAFTDKAGKLTEGIYGQEQAVDRYVTEVRQGLKAPSVFTLVMGNTTKVKDGVTYRHVYESPNL